MDTVTELVEKIVKGKHEEQTIVKSASCSLGRHEAFRKAQKAAETNGRLYMIKS